MERCAKSGEDRSPPSEHRVKSRSVSSHAAVGGTLTAAAVPAHRLSAGEGLAEREGCSDRC